MPGDRTPTPAALARLPSSRKSGQEPLHEGGVPSGKTLLDFWRWAASDLLGNTSRGVLAEFLVALSLGVSVDDVRDEWAPCDFTTPEGLTVQVKSSAFVQSWAQRSLSRVVFSVRPSRAWDANTNILASDSVRHAKVYVFALLAHSDKSSIDPLDLSQWRFFVLPTSTIGERARTQTSITLKDLKSLAGEGVGFQDLREAVRYAAGR
jgi:hypothetical protein